MPVLVAIRRVGPWGSFLLGLTTGFTFFAGLLYWISMFGYLPWAMLCLMQGLYVAVFALLANAVYRRGRMALLIVPALWTLMEWARSLGMFGFTWGDLAYSQARWSEIIQIASVTGPWGLTFLIVLVNASIAGFLTSRNRRSRICLAAAALSVLVACLHGMASMRSLARVVPDKQVAMVQGNVELTWPDPRTNDRIRQTYWPMTESVGKADFVLWPESALPGDLLYSSYLKGELSSLARSTGAYMLVGGSHEVPDRKAPGGAREYNGAYLISPSGELIGSYYKVRLVPFGEFIPGRSWLPFINRYPIMETDRFPGPGYYPVRTNKGDIGVMICFESTFPQIGRELAENGAGVLFVITNDSWFQRTAAGEQHHDFSIFRAVENRRYVARNATTGISSLITPWGEVTSSAGLDRKAVVRGAVAMIHTRTIYTRYGDWFVLLCGALGLIGLIIPMRNGTIADC